LALGHTQKLPAFETMLKQLVAAYPTNELVTPLVKEHLQYIEKNRAQMLTRNTALLEYDPSASFFDEPQQEPQVAQARIPEIPGSPVKETKAISPSPEKAQTPVAEKEPAGVIPSEVNENLINAKKTEAKKDEVPALKPATPMKAEDPDVLPAPKPKPVNTLFSLPGAGEYYFVVNVTEARYNLSSSRFGIGQFNRTRYAGTALRHQLQEVAENQLVYVGSFKTFEEVKSYENTILPLMKDIMKIPAEHYSTFVITKEGLDKLNSRQLIDSYIEFYKNSN
jgi:hypothetical protein